MDQNPVITGLHGLALVARALPQLIVDAGPAASRRFVEFFTANIQNANTRAAYARAVSQFCAWCEMRGFELQRLQPVVIAAYIEDVGRRRSKQSVKQHLAAIRMLFDCIRHGNRI